MKKNDLSNEIVKRNDRRRIDDGRTGQDPQPIKRGRGELAERPDDRFLARVGGPRLSARQIDELTGFVRGIIADDVVSPAEVAALKSWLAVNHGITYEPVLADLATRIDEVLQDGQVDAEECRELLELLKGLCGTSAPGELMKSTSLPLCKPPPALTFAGRRYCFTGTFSFGRRQACEQAVIGLGAQCAALTKKTEFLVVGIYATDSWKHSSYGTKIMRAAEWRSTGTPISIVGEDHWAAELRRHGQVH